MQINSKYNIGDKIWVVYEHQGEVSVYDDVISDICVNSDGLYYVLETVYENNKEEDIIAYEDKEALVKKIEQIMQEIHMRESEDKQC